MRIGRKKTHEEFLGEFRLLEKTIDVIGNYTGIKNKIKVRCRNCKFEWEPIADQLKNSSSGCPECAGNIKQTTHIFAETVHLEVGNEYSILGEYINSSTQLKMKHNVCNGTWMITPSNFSRGRRCPFCSNRKVLIGLNDMWTTNPDLASLLASPNDGYKYSQYSSKKINWKCPECKEIIKNKKVSQINQYKISCPRCSDGRSYPEKFMFNFLKSLSVDFYYDESQLWSENKRYDFYLPKYKMIIEVHGEQHYNNSFETLGGKTAQEEQENDALKRNLAFENGIEHYVEINATESEPIYLEMQIRNSELSNFFCCDKLDWNLIREKSLKSLVKTASEIWNDEIKSAEHISSKMKISKATALKYIKQADSVGWCVYNRIDSKELGMKKLNKKTIQLSIDGEFVKEWESVKEAAEFFNINGTNIASCCRGLIITSQGFRWMYEDSYKRYLHGKIKLREIKPRDQWKKQKPRATKKVIQLDRDLKFLKEWDGVSEILKALTISASMIRGCCKGKKKTAGGFKWMYKEDYDQLTTEQEKSDSIAI